MNENVLAKLKILAESAKYDVSCSSSGTVRSNKPGMLGNTVGGWGICHSFAEDGRCISLLKIMLTNYCIYDCAYCVNRRSNDLPRATFSVSELVELTMEFYRRNYIEGLFLSSGVVRNPDYTMERLVRVAKDLRLVHRFNGYIHLKSIPGASRELVNEAGLYADRLSVNVEIPKEENLKLLAPEKDHKSVFAPMKYIQQGVLESKEERQKFRHAPRFAPAGQSTQMIVGATSESDKDILFLSSALYGRPTMKRVYYSGYVSVNTYDKRLPALKQPPLVRENRLYQADWLLRFYQFKVDEIVDDAYPLRRQRPAALAGALLVRAEGRLHPHRTAGAGHPEHPARPYPARLPLAGRGARFAGKVRSDGRHDTGAGPESDFGRRMNPFHLIIKPHKMRCDCAFMFGATVA